MKKGEIYFVKCTIGINHHVSAQKVRIQSIRRVNGEIISYRCAVLEDFRVSSGFCYNSKEVLYTYRNEIIGLNKPYQFFSTRLELLQALNIYFDNQQKLIEISRKECQCFTN